jgi:hypothetical protein
MKTEEVVAVCSKESQSIPVLEHVVAASKEVSTPLPKMAMEGLDGPYRSAKVLNFALEDTNERSYRYITSSLLSHGWNKVLYRRRSKLEMKRLPAKNVPSLIWTLNDRDIDFKQLTDSQICNHFEGISQLTTKRGFCELLRDNMQWISEDQYDIAPRCYNLGDPLHREEFVEDFRFNALMIILKHALNSLLYEEEHGQQQRQQEINDLILSKDVRLSRKTFLKCVNILRNYLRINCGGEWPGVEYNGFSCEEVESSDGICIQIHLTGATPLDWDEILNASYELVEKHSNHVPMDWGCVDKCDGEFCETCLNSLLRKRFSNPTIYKLLVMFKGTLDCNMQCGINGSRNIWVVKAPEASCGTGLKLFYRLDDILESERGFGGRTVQKYIESPLLAPKVVNNNSSRQASNTPSTINSMRDNKFDIRVWVLVTSFVPLKAHIYTRVYGRKCGYSYDLNIKNLNENLIHLTNYSVQRKNNVDDSSTNTTQMASGGSDKSTNNNNSSSSASNVVKNLRTKIDNIRTATEIMNDSPDLLSSDNASEYQKELLLSHEEIIEILQGRKQEQEQRWISKTWPDIKRKIIAVLRSCSASSSIASREKSFELLGFDVIFDKGYNPWILEVNMSPAMAHRSEDQSKLIESMSKGLIDIAILPHVSTSSPAEKIVDNTLPTEGQNVSNNNTVLRNFYNERLKAVNTGNNVPESTPRSNNDTTDINVDVATAKYGCWEKLVVPVVPSVIPKEYNTVSGTPIINMRPNQAKDWTIVNEPKTIKYIYNGNNKESSREHQSIVTRRPQSAGLSRRPRSASATRRNHISPRRHANADESSSNNNGNNEEVTVNTIEIGFALQGFAVKPKDIDCVDNLCHQFEKVVLIQRWARRYLIRTRLFHSRQLSASVRIQKCCVHFLKKCRKWHMKRCKASIRMQRQIRKLLAINCTQRLRKRGASIKLQLAWLSFKARHLRKKLFLSKMATMIKRWYERRVRRYQFKMSSKIVRITKKWLTFRKRMAKRVYHCLRLFYLSQVRKRNLVYFFVRFFVRHSKETKRKRVLLYKQIVAEVALKALEIREMKRRKIIEEEMRRRQNFEHVTNIIITEALVSGDTLLNIAVDSYHTMHSEYKQQQEQQQERNTIQREEIMNRNSFSNKVADNLSHHLNQQTHDLLRDARGVLNSPDYKLYRESRRRAQRSEIKGTSKIRVSKTVTDDEASDGIEQHHDGMECALESKNVVVDSSSVHRGNDRKVDDVSLVEKTIGIIRDFDKEMRNNDHHNFVTKQSRDHIPETVMFNGREIKRSPEILEKNYFDGYSITPQVNKSVSRKMVGRQMKQQEKQRNKTSQVHDEPKWFVKSNDNGNGSTNINTSAKPDTQATTNTLRARTAGRTSRPKSASNKFSRSNNAIPSSSRSSSAKKTRRKKSLLSTQSTVHQQRQGYDHTRDRDLDNMFDDYAPVNDDAWNMGKYAAQTWDGMAMAFEEEYLSSKNHRNNSNRRKDEEDLEFERNEMLANLIQSLKY